jgi:methanogenic corrinoid protein MtbC1
MLTHRVPAEIFIEPVLATQALPTPENIADLVALSLKYDVDAAASYVAALRAQGTLLDVIYLDLLAPAARRLGELWIEDLCDFTQVTVGLCCLQQLLHELSADFHSESADEFKAQDRRVLLAPIPGEQHTFGLYMVMEFFRRAGWDVWESPVTASHDLTEIVHRDWFEVVGFSLSCETRIEQLTAVIRAIRRASCNPRVGVLVGGRVFAEHPEFVALVGADAMAGDGKQSVLQAEQLVTLLAQDRNLAG